jgi:hypothetical protein
MTITRRHALAGAAATVAAAALPAVAVANAVAVDEEYLSFLARCLRDGLAPWDPYVTRWTGMLVYQGRRCMIIQHPPNSDVAELCWFGASEDVGIEAVGFTPDDIINRAGMRKKETWYGGKSS